MSDFFTGALGQAGALAGTERLPADAPSGASEWVSPLQLGKYVEATWPTGAYSAAGNTSGFTATVGQVEGARKTVLDLTGALAAGANVVTPGADAMVAGLPGGGFVGETWVLRVVNNSSAAFSWTLQGGSGVTVVGTATVAQHTWREWLCTVTGAAAVGMQNIGSGTN